MNLFTYGTLRVARIIEHFTGRTLVSQKAFLKNYACFYVKGELFPGIKLNAGQITEGTLYKDLHPHEFEKLDTYEGALYERQLLNVFSETDTPLNAYVYIIKPELEYLLSNKLWTLHEFEEKHLEAYMRHNHLKK